MKKVGHQRYCCDDLTAQMWPLAAQIHSFTDTDMLNKQISQQMVQINSIDKFYLFYLFVSAYVNIFGFNVINGECSMIYIHRYKQIYAIQEFKFSTKRCNMT